MYMGNIKPAIIPMQKVSAAKPTALQPREHNMVTTTFPTADLPCFTVRSLGNIII